MVPRYGSLRYAQILSQTYGAIRFKNIHQYVTLLRYD